MPLARAASYWPADPVAERAPHHQLEIPPLEPGQFFGEKRHALTIRARHARHVGSPEHAFRAERAEDLLEIRLDVAIGIRLARIAGHAGCLDCDVRIPGKREQISETGETRFVL